MTSSTRSKRSEPSSHTPIFDIAKIRILSFSSRLPQSRSMILLLFGFPQTRSRCSFRLRHLHRHRSSTHHWMPISHNQELASQITNNGNLVSHLKIRDNFVRYRMICKQIYIKVEIFRWSKIFWCGLLLDLVFIEVIWFETVEFLFNLGYFT